MKISPLAQRTARIITKPVVLSSIYPKAWPSDLISHCSFGKLSKPSFTVKRHERHLTPLLCWRLTFTTPAPRLLHHPPPAPCS